MITLFTVPRHFKDSVGIHQLNAIKSWQAIMPDCEIIIFGDEEGCEQVSNELGLRQVKNIDVNEYGTPKLDFIFNTAQEIAAYDYVCYINTDIILLDDFRKSVEIVTREEKCMFIGNRFDIDLDKNIDFSSNWQDEIKAYALKSGQWKPRAGSDYFLFKKGTVQNFPPFLIGRPRWDNWLIGYAKLNKFKI